MSDSFYMPAYFLDVRRVEKEWWFPVPKRIFSIRDSGDKPVDSDFFTCREEHYGLTKAKLVLEFRLLTGGALGYYLADMKRKRYYFCGPDVGGVREQLLALGIGRRDPHDTAE